MFQQPTMFGFLFFCIYVIAQTTARNHYYYSTDESLDDWTTETNDDDHVTATSSCLDHQCQTGTTAAPEAFTNNRSFTEIPVDDIPLGSQSVTITNTNITALPNNTFSAFRMLKNVKLLYNKIHTVSPSAFENCPVVYLDLTGNKLTYVPNFNAIRDTLKDLILNENPIITAIFDGWKPFPFLSRLYMSYSEIQTLPYFNSSYLAPGLRYFFVDRNNISQLDTEVLSLYRCHIQLTANRIVSIPDTSTLNIPISSLDLRYNNLDSVGITFNSFAGFTELTYLTLRVNKFSMFPNVTRIGGTLRYFDIGQNRIPNLHSGCMAGLTVLKYLNMSCNYFQAFPDFTLAGLPIENRLDQLDLDDNQITTIASSSLVPLNRLEKLYLNNNNIKVLSTLSHLRFSLQKLEIRKNGLIDIPNDALSDLSLTEIRLDRNNLTSLPNLENSTTSLLLLDLARNPIMNNTSLIELATYINSFVNLENLYLSGTGLTSLPKIKLGHLTKIHLAENDLTCDPSFCWARKLVQMEVVGLGNFKCFIPELNQTLLWHEVDTEYLCRMPENDTDGNGIYGSAMMSTVWNSQGASLAIDGDPDTCALTGYEGYPWWKVKFSRPFTVSGATLNARISGEQEIIVRVGNGTNEYDHFEGHNRNPACVSKVLDHADTGNITLRCTTPISGLYLSVAKVPSANHAEQLSLCEVYVF